jgi:hypothetical protein
VVTVLSLLFIAIPASPALAATVVIFPESGPPNTIVSLVGFGFNAGESYSLTFGANPAGSGLVDGSGGISTTFNVPGNTPRGSYVVRITDTGGGLGQAIFVLTPELVYVSGATGKVGAQATVNGGGFQASSDVDILFDDVSVATIASSVVGSINNVTFNIPEGANGVHTIRGADAFGVSNDLDYTVLSDFAIDPISGSAGDQITAAGTGFAADKTVTLTLDGQAVTTDPAVVTTNSLGSFSALFTIPTTGRGAYEIEVEDEDGNLETATVTVGEKMEISPVTGFVGTQVTISGNGFGANKVVTITIDDIALTTEPATVTANASGTFSATFVVPNATKGAHTLKVEDDIGSSATAIFTVEHKMGMDPASGLVGDEVSVNGTGFVGNAIITISFDGVGVATATSDAGGSFGPTSFIVPAATKGVHEVEVQDAIGNSASMPYTVAEEMSITPGAGFVGDQITLIGTGFGANRTLTIAIDGVSIGTANTDAIGNINTVFTIPPGTQGEHTVSAIDSAGNSDTAILTVQHQMTMTPTSGIAGTTIAVAGTGFGGSKQVTIRFDNSLVATSPLIVTTDVNGNLNASFTLPALPAGTYTVEVSEGTISVVTSVTVERTVTISETTNEIDPGYVGMEFSITGTGFQASSPVTIIYQSDPVEVASTSTDSSGSFAVVFTIPASAGGEHTITVSDGQTTEQFDFFMETTEPGPPVPLSPPMGFKPKQPVGFDWQDVDDISGPVIYTLQIAIDIGFNNIVLEKTGLTESAYTLTEEEELDTRSDKEPYYWRVQAVDSASNVSLYSGTGIFIIGFIWPSYMIYIWIGLGVVILGLLAFWLGRRFAYASY